MSYDCDSIEILSGKLYIQVAAARKLRGIEGLDGMSFPECCFLDDLEEEINDSKKNPIEHIEIPSLSWCGEGSGHTWDWFREHVVPCLKGRAECLATWEGGDSIDGFLITCGKYVSCDIEYVLTPKPKEVTPC